MEATRTPMAALQTQDTTTMYEANTNNMLTEDPAAVGTLEWAIKHA